VVEILTIIFLTQSVLNSVIILQSYLLLWLVVFIHLLFNPIFCSFYLFCCICQLHSQRRGGLCTLLDDDESVAMVHTWHQNYGHLCWISL